MTCSCALLRRAGRQITNLYDEALKPVGLTLSQYSLLAVLAREGPGSLNVLARRMDMDRTTLSRNLVSLERAGWVMRTEGGDRRSRRIGLTRRGDAKLAAAKPHWAKVEQHVRDCLGPDDLARLHAAMDAVLKKLGAPAPAS